MTTQTQERPAGPSPGTGRRPKVAVVYARPETALEDIARAMRLSDHTEHLARGVQTLLKINISWQHYYPGCSTTPWQLEGVVRALRADGYADLVAAHNSTV
ncbi:MAG: hypothetical protein FJ315_07935, partial [SAR202 cluster bacterium]|nr:hypothetical protein [SAR202 cluster bacterium]